MTTTLSNIGVTQTSQGTSYMFCHSPSCPEYNKEQPVPTEYNWETCHQCDSLLEATPDTDAPELEPHDLMQYFGSQTGPVESWDWMAEEVIPVIAAWYRLIQKKGSPWEQTRNKDAAEFMRLVRKYGERKPE